MLGTSYRPYDTDEFENLSEATNLFINGDTGGEVGKIQNEFQSGDPIYGGQDVSDVFLGPVRMGTVSAGVFTPITDIAAGSAGSNPSIYYKDLATDHVVLIAIEGVQPGTTFELEMIRHFEGHPIDEQGQRELRTARLVSENDPLTLLRRLHVSDFTISPSTYYLMQQAGIHYAGLWDLPIFSTIADVVNWGIDRIQAAPDMAQLVADVIPTAMGLLVQQVPILAELRGPVEDLLRDKLRALLLEDKDIQ